MVFSVVYWVTFVSLHKLYNRPKYFRYIPTARHAKKLVNHTISTLHACWSVLSWVNMVWISCKLPGSTMFGESECFHYTSPGMEFYLLVSLSYFINDGLSLRSVFGKNSRTNLTYFHHGICTVGVVAALVIGRAVGVVI